MNESISHCLEKLLCKKIDFYNKLIHYLEEEQKCLITMDFHNLWQIATAKEKICSGIKTLREQIISTIEPEHGQLSFGTEGLLRKVPEKTMARLQNLRYMIIKQKLEIEYLRKQNMAFVEDTLRFLDDIISIIAYESTGTGGYNGKSRQTAPRPNIFFSREA